MLRDLAKVKDITKLLLVNHPELRDNDELLILEVNTFFGRVIKTRHSQYGVGYFIPKRYVTEKKLIKFESIRRTRQKIQEEMPELRGKSYSKRQEEAQFVKLYMKRVG